MTMSSKKRKAGCLTYEDTLNREHLKKVKMEIKQKTEEDMMITVVLQPYNMEVPQSYVHVIHWAKELYTNLSIFTKELETPNKLFLINSAIISPNYLQQPRFPKTNIIKHEVIDVIYTKTMQEKLFTLENESAQKGIRIRGPSGAGKSFLMILFMLRLRADPKNRVFYFNNPLAMRDKPRVYVANEFIFAFCNDLNEPNFPTPEPLSGDKNKEDTRSKIQQWYDYLCSENFDEKTCNDLIKRLRNYCTDKGLCFIFIIDQMNEFERCKRSDEPWATTFLHCFNQGQCEKFIYSASDNNEEFNVNKMFPTLHITQIFTDEDIPLLLYLGGYEGLNAIVVEVGQDKERKVEWEANEKVSQIIEATGRNPYEISYILKILMSHNQSPQSDTQPKDDVKKEHDITNQIDIKPTIDAKKYDLIEEYFSLRISDYSTMQLNYWDKPLTTIAKESAYRVSIAVDTGIELGQDQKYDRNLIYEVPGSTPKCCRFYSVCPAAFKAIEISLSSNREFAEWNNKTQSRVIYNDFLNIIAMSPGEFNQAMRGHALEKLLIDGLSSKAFFSAGYQNLEYYLSKTVKQKQRLDVHHVQYFKTNELLSKMRDALLTGRGTLDILFVPLSSNFSLIDCLLLKAKYNDESVDGQKKKCDVTLYLLQTTINIVGHEKGDGIINDHLSKKELCGHEICQALLFLEEFVNEESENKEFTVKYQFIWLTYENLELDKVKFDKLDQKSWVASMKENLWIF